MPGQWALVQKPDRLFLDEAISAVDEPTEARLYRLLRKRLPSTVMLSVGHRSTLRPFHARQILVQPGGAGLGVQWSGKLTAESL